MKRRIQKIKNRIIVYGVVTAMLLAEIMPVGYVLHATETPQETVEENQELDVEETDEATTTEESTETTQEINQVESTEETVDYSVSTMSEEVVYEDLNVTSNYTLTSDMTVGDFTMPYSSTLNLNGYALTIMGDAYISNGSIDFNNGEIICKGKFDVRNGSNIYMDNVNDYLYVEGDTYVYCTPSVSSGIIELKGNLVVTERFKAKGTNTIIFAGQSKQVVNLPEGGYFANVELQNYSEDGIYIEYIFKYNNLITNDCVIQYSDLGGERGYKLEEDVTIDGLFYMVLDTLDLNGHTMTINGDLIQGGGTIDINGGKLIINGNYKVQTMTKQEETISYGTSNGKLIMNDSEDYIYIQGDYINNVGSDQANTLTYGTMEIQGNISVTNNIKYRGLISQNQHTIVLSGTTRQNVYIKGYTEYAYDNYNAIANLKLANTSEEGVCFEQPVYISRYMAQNDVPITGKIITGNSTKIEGNVYNGDLLISGNIQDTLSVNGDVTILGTQDIYGSLYVYGSVYGSKIHMPLDKSYLYIQGDLKCWEASFGCGKTEIKGDINVSNAIISNTNHKLILSGDELQTITNSGKYNFGTVEITNASTDGVYSDGVLSANEIITNGCRLRYEGVEGEFGWTVSEDVTYEGDLILLGGKLDLNGHTLTVNGSLIQMSGDININNGKLIVNNDYIMRNRKQEGETYTYSSCKAGLVMQNESDYILVNGDFVCETIKEGAVNLTNGIFEVKGDFQVIKSSKYNNYFVGKENHTFVFSGEEPQTLTLDYTMTMSKAEMKNTSQEGIKIVGNLYVTSYLNDYDTIIDGYIQINSDTQLEDREFGASLYVPDGKTLYIREALTVLGNVNNQGSLYIYADFVVEGDFTYSNYTYIYEKMIVNGDITSTGYGTINMNSGELTVYGDCNISYGTNGLKLNNSDDYVHIYGDFLCATYCTNYLYNGVLCIDGDANIDGTFTSSGNGKILFAGDKLQTVTVDSDIVLNIVELKNYSEEGIYCPKLFAKNQFIRNGCNIRFGDCEGEFGWIFEKDMVWEGDLVIIDDTLDLNGHTLTVTGDFIQMSGNVDINNGKLYVNGDYRMQSITQSGENITYGDSAGRLTMDNSEDYVCVGGDMILSQTISNKGCITDGTLELKGNLAVDPSKFSMEGSSNLILSGDKAQQITLSTSSYALNLMGFEYSNTSGEPITIAGKLYLNGLVDIGEGSFSDYVYIRQGATFADNYFKGNVYLYTCTIKSEDVPTVIDGTVKLIGTLNVYGDMVVNGDLYSETSGYLKFHGGSLTVNGNYTSDSIYMVNASDYLLVNGDAKLYGDYATNITNGTIEVTGDLVTDSYNSTSGNNKIILSGNQQQIITIDSTKGINILELKNTSQSGVYSENYFACNEIILNNSKLTIGSGDYVVGGKLTQDTVISGDYLLGYGTLDLNGYTLTIEGDLIHANGNIDINGGTLNVNGNYHMRVRNVDNENYNWTKSSGTLIMDNSGDTINIQGDMNLECESNACYEDIVEGVIKVCGDVTCHNRTSFYTYDNNVFILNGTEKQIVNSNLYVDNLNLYNLEEVQLNKNVYVYNTLDATCDVTGSGTIYLSNLEKLVGDTYNGNLVLTENSNMDSNKIINGNLTINGDIHVNSYELTANNISLNETMYVDEGRVNCKNDFNINYKYGELNMTKDAGYVCVGRDITVAGTGTLTAGTLEVRGNITNKYTTLSASGTHKTILAVRLTSTGREYIQTVNFANSGDKLNILVLQKEADGYVFSRDVETMANEIIYDIKDYGTPSPVQDISVVSCSVSSITIAYTPQGDSKGVFGYYIYRDGNKIGSTSSTTYTDVDLKCNTEYTYEVYPYDAYKNVAESSPSVKAITLADTESPSIPQDLSVTGLTGTSVTLVWSPSTDNKGVIGYKIYKDGELIGETDTQTSYKDSGANCNTYSEYKVVAFDEAGNVSDYSTSISARGSMPQITSVSPEDYKELGKGAVTLKVYFKNYGPKESYTVNIEYYDYKTDTWFYANNEPLKVSEYNSGTYCASYVWNVSNLTGSEYDVRYVVIDEDGNEASKKVTYYIDNTPPIVPNKLEGKADSGVVLLSWSLTTSGDAVGYNIYRRIAGEETYKKIASVTDMYTTLYTDSTTEFGVEYEYGVTAFDEAGNESAKTISSTILCDEDETAPEIKSATPEAGKVNKSVTIKTVATDNKSVKYINFYCVKDGEEEATFLAEVEARENTAIYNWDTSSYEDGVYHIIMVAIDETGNVSEEFGRRYEVDNTGINKITVTDINTGINYVQLMWEDVTETDFAYFQIEQWTQNGYVTVGKETQILGYVMENLNPNTTYKFRVVGYDKLGNRGVESDIITTTTMSDTVAPSITSVYPTGTYYNNSIPLSMTVTDNSWISHGSFYYSTDNETFVKLKDVYATGNVKSTTFSYTMDITGFEEGSIYIKYEAYDKAGNKNNLLTDGEEVVKEYIVDKTTPSKMEKFTATSKDGYIALTWDEPSDTDLAYYRIYRAEEEDGFYSILVDKLQATNYYDTTVEPGKAYVYKAVAVDLAGNISPESEESMAMATADVTAPTIRGIYPADGATVGEKVKFQALAVDNANLDKIIVEYKISGEDIWIPLCDRKITGTNYHLETQFDLTGMVVDNYQIRVQTIDKAGNVSPYTYATYTIDTIPPTASIEAKGYDFYIQLYFGMPEEEDASHFEIYKREVYPSGTRSAYSLITTTNSLAYKDSNVEPYTDYEYKLRVYDIYGNYREYESAMCHATDNDTESPIAILPENMRIIEGVSLTLDGCESTDNIRINKYTWDMGNGDIVYGSRPEYHYEEAGTYNLTLTVEDEAGNVSTTTSAVRVIEPTGNGTIHLKITDENGTPLPYAYVYINDGEDLSLNYKTDGYGELVISGVEGTYEVAAYKTGYIPKDMKVTFNQYETNEYVLAIPKGEIVVGDFEIHRMNMQEIIDAGVDISDPRNMNSCTFTAEFKFKETPIPITIEYIDNGYSGEYAAGYWDVNGGGFGTDNITFDHLTSDGKPSKGKLSFKVISVPVGAAVQEEQPVFVYVKTTQTVSWLKDMYMVELGVLNNADYGYVIEDSYATLNLPEGISLAITSAGQSLTNYMGDIWGQDKVYTSWVVKGDTPGDYTISADFVGTLQPFDCPVNAHFEAKQTIDISDYSGLLIEIMPENVGYAANQYFVQFKITNNTGRPLYNFTTSIGPYVAPGIKYVRYVYDPEKGKMVYDKENSFEGETHVYSELSTCDQTLVMMGGDQVKIPTLSEGMSIYGTYSQLFPGGDPTAYYALVDSMVEVIQGNELNITFEVKPIASHVTKQFVQYVERESVFGDPVDVTTGAYLDAYEAIALTGDAILSLDLSYNSLTSDILGETGYGWSHNFESYIVKENGLIHYYMAPGYPVAFVNEDSLDGKIYGTYKYGEFVMSDTVYGDTITYRSISPYMEGYVLTKNADDTYTMTTPAGYIYDYDWEGRLTGMVMEDGSSVTITRTANQVIVTEDVSGKRIKLDYTEGMLTAVSDDTGRITKFIYTDGYLTEIINPVGEHIYYSYDEGGRLNEASNTDQEVFVSNVYDETGRVISQKDGYGEEITFTYTETETGLITVAKDPEGIPTTIVSDKMCNILEVTNEEGVKTSYSYDSDGNMLTSTDTYGNSYTYTYDEKGNLVSKKGSDGEDITLSYNDAGYITGMTMGNGSSISYTYNENNQVIQAVEGDITVDYTYDEAGRMTSLAGPEGRTTTYGYEGVSDLPVTITDTAGNVITMEYDALGNLVKVTDALGNPTSYQYDAMNRLTKLIHPNGGVISYTYDEYGNINSVTDALGYTSSFSYDVLGRMTGITYADGSRENFTYDALGNVVQRTAPDGRIIKYEYDVSGNLTKETYPDGTYKTYTYDPSGRLLSSTDIYGNVTGYTYDGSGEIAAILQSDGTVVTPIYGTGTTADKIIGIDYGDGTVVTSTYDEQGNLTDIKDPMGNITSYSYNAYGEVTEAVDAKGNKTTYSYDNLGNCIKITYPNGTVISTTYDPAGNPLTISTQVTDILTGEVKTVGVSYGYDCMGNVISYTDELGNKTYYEYDLMNRLTRIIDASGNTEVEYTYDCMGRILQEKTSDGIVKRYIYNVSSQVEKVTMVSPSGAEKTYTYTYDDMGRILTVTDPAGITTSENYDEVGNLSEIVYPQGGGISYSYDNYGRLTEEKLSIGTTYSYEYNSDSQLSLYTNGRGQETSYTYDKLGRIISFTDALGTVSYTYDANGNVLVVSETDNSGATKTITRTYDCMNQVTSYTDYNGNTVKYGYDELGNIISLTYAGGEIVRYSYYDNGLMESVVDGEGYKTSYTYDSSGRLLTTENPDGSIETNTYNDRGLLATKTLVAYGEGYESDIPTASVGTTGTSEDTSGQVVYSYSYTYDDWGNIISISCVNPDEESADTTTLTSTTMTYDESNRMLTYNGEDILYDEDGNMVYGPLDGVMTEFEYDCRNRLVKAGDTTYQYDAEDVRIAVETPEYRDEYVTDSVTSLTRVLEAERTYKETSNQEASQETVKSTYCYGNGLIYEKHSEEGLLVYHYDHLGSTKAITDASGRVVATYNYGTYGELLTDTTEYDAQRETRFLYNGQLGVVTDDNGLYYMRARYYNPDIKRFINQDILTGSIGNHKSLNRYSYVQGNPVSYTDPFGLSPFSYISEPIHSVLSMAGCIPFIGNFFDGLNSVVYLMEGEPYKAALNLTSLIPGDKLGKYVVKNGKKIAATTAVTAVICQTDAGAGIKQGLNNAKNEIVEFYGLDDMSAADYVFMTVFGLQFAKGAKGGMLDIDLPTRNKSPEIEFAGTGVTVKADSIDDVINKADDVVPANVNKGGVEFDEWLNKGNNDNKVYFGIDMNGNANYTGITKQTKDARLYQHNRNGKNFSDLEIQYDNLTRNQARAIEQYFIENGPNDLNKINSISQSSIYYQDAIKWAKQYLDIME